MVKKPNTVLASNGTYSNRDISQIITSLNTKLPLWGVPLMTDVQYFACNRKFWPCSEGEECEEVLTGLINDNSVGVT